MPGQLSLFDGLDAQTGHVQPKMPAAPSPLPQGRGGEELLLAGGGPAALPLQERRTGAQRRLEPKSGAVPGNGARPGAGRSAPRPQTAPRAFAALKPAVEALF